MSWIKENYEKAALAGGAVVAVGIGAMIVFGGGEPVSADAKKFTQHDDVDVKTLAEIDAVLQQRTESAMIRPKVDLFVGQPIYKKLGSSEPVDLLESPPVHEGIQNAWWRKHGIDISYANAPERDHDKDGFTNQEEHDADTNPASKESYPNPLAKLEGDGVSSYKFRMRWSEFGSDTVTLRFIDTQGNSLSEQVKHGGVAFSKEPVEGRFQLAAERVKETDSKGQAQDAYYLTDNLPNYKGTAKAKKLLLRRGPLRGQTEFQDFSVSMRLNALGRESEVFTVGEFESFSLPYDPAATEKPYKVTSIKEQAGQPGAYAVSIEYSAGGSTSSKQFIVNKK